jgi:hypothetical protein
MLSGAPEERRAILSAESKHPYLQALVPSAQNSCNHELLHICRGPRLVNHGHHDLGLHSVQASAQD